MKLKSNHIPWIILLLVVLYFGWREYSHSKNEDKLVSDIAMYNGIVDTLTLQNGALITSNNTLTLHSEEQLKSIVSQLNDTIKLMVKKFKNLSSVTYITNNFEAGNDSSSFASAIPCDFKPFKARYSDSTYSIAQTIHRDRFVIDTLKVPNKTVLVFGKKKVGFMKYDNFVDINNSNPLMVASNIKNYTFTPEKKWHETRLANMAFGALIQTGISLGVRTLINK